MSQGLSASSRRRSTLAGRDLAEIVMGSLVLAFPVAVTEEVWVLSSEMSLLRTLLISLGSLCVISIFVRTTYFHETTFASSRQVLARSLTVYGMTMLTVGVVLLAIDRLPLFDATLVAFKRTVLVSFPASFAATAVDSIGD